MTGLADNKAPAGGAFSCSAGQLGIPVYRSGLASGPALATYLDSLGQHGEQGLGIVPAQAGVGDRLAIGEFVQWRRLLAAPLQEALDHDGGDGVAAFPS